MDSDIKYEIVEDDVTGRRLNLFSPYSSSVQNLIEKNEFESILLSQRLGWESQDIDFLKNIKNLKCLYIYDDKIKDLSVISELKDLEVLYLECNKVNKGPYFNELKKLKDVRVDWRPCFNSLFHNKNIEVLRIDSFQEKDLSNFEVNSKLERLDLVMGPITSLKGVTSFPSLIKLMVYRCSKLTNINDINNLNLIELEIESCKKIENLEEVLNIKSLESLIIDKCNTMKNINGVSALTNLIKMTISETSIIDGNISELMKLKNTDVYIDNKKHYSHKLNEIRAIINAQ